MVQKIKFQVEMPYWIEITNHSLFKKKFVLENTKSGKLRNAENHAIVLENLLDDQNDFFQLKKQWDLPQ